MRKTILLAIASLSILHSATAQEKDTTQQSERILPIDEVVVTGSRIATDRRLLPMTISVLDRKEIESFTDDYITSWDELFGKFEKKED